MNFTRYETGAVWPTRITFADLLVEQLDHGMLFARAELSGSEGCYVEVCRWNDANWRYERYAFVKLLSGEEYTELFAGSTVDAAREMAWRINAAGNLRDEDARLIHRMPNWAGEGDESRTAGTLEEGQG
jgi:hypothetical protein